MRPLLTVDFRTCAGKAAAPGLTRFQETFCALHGADSANPTTLIEIILENGFRDLLQEKYPDAGLA